MKITREKLQEAIEAGIAACDYIIPADAAALRAVGATANLVATGTFADVAPGHVLVGCPLMQASLVNYDEHGEIEANEDLTEFFMTFDDFINSRVFDTILEVEG